MKCIICKIEQEEEAFLKKNGKGLTPRCISCRVKQGRKMKAWRERRPDYMSNHSRQYKYGLSPEEFQGLLSAQNNKCGICEGEIPKPCVDHCHTSGNVRGLLCYRCNTALGKFKESIPILEKAIKYLKKDT